MSAPGTPEERFEAALAVTNPHGWGNLSQQDGYADRFRRLKDLVSRDPELVRLSGGARNYTLLHHAAWGNGTEVAEFLLANGAVADARANGGNAARGGLYLRLGRQRNRRAPRRALVDPGQPAYRYRPGPSGTDGRVLRRERGHSPSGS